MKFLKLGGALCGLAIMAVLLVANPTHASNNQGNPPGNNGFVKINNEVVPDSIPQNHPHVTCKFRIDFYNYDKNFLNFAWVDFDLQAPTAGPGYNVSPSFAGPIFIGQDSALGGNDLDASEEVTLNFTGTPAVQGYHVKVTVHADGSQGSDKKHKVFWVEPCGKPKAPEVTVKAGPCVAPNVIANGTATVTVENKNAVAQSYKVTLNGVTKDVTVAADSSEQVVFTGLAPGTYPVVVKDGKKFEVTKSVTIESCPAVTPTVGKKVVSCFGGQQIGAVTISVTNPNTYDVTYQVALGGVTQTAVVAAGVTKDVQFAPTPGSYTVTIVGDNDTRASTQVTVDKCPAHKPKVSVAPGTCVDKGALTGTVTVLVKNTNTYNVIYTVTVNGVSKDVTIAPKSKDTIVFTGLAAGTYKVVVKGDNDTKVKTKVTLDECPLVIIPTPTPTPQVLGATTSIATPASIPATGMSGQSIMFSLIPAALTYAVLYRRQKRLAAQKN